MVTMTGVYEGKKHCALTHGPSQAKINTDAPKDNNGLLILKKTFNLRP